MFDCYVAFSIGAVVSVLASVSHAWQIKDVPTEKEAEAIVDRILALPHGPLFAQPSDRALMRILLDNSDIFFPILAERLQVLGDTKVEHLDSDYVAGCVGVLGLAAAFGSQRAGNLVYGTFATTSERLDEILVGGRAHGDLARGTVTEREWGIINSLGLLFDFALEKLTEFGDARAIDGVMKRVEKVGLGPQTVIFRYLEKVAPLRPVIRPQLQMMYDSPTSPLRNHPQLLRVLEAMDSAATEAKKEAGNDKSRDGNRKDE
jgi:hypothetical protein